MDTLRTLYKGHLRRALVELRTLRADPSPQARTRLRRVAHRLKGSGSSYGYPGVTRAGEALESAAAGGGDTQGAAARLRAVIEDVLNPADQGEPSPPPRSGERTALVIDDDPSIRRLIAFSLSRASWRVLTAANEREALEHLDHDTPDLLLLDLHLAEGSGLQAYLHLARAWGRRRSSRLRALLLTGADDYPTLPPGVLGVLRKPFDLVSLPRTLDELLSEPERSRLLLQ